ncbi:CRP/FNR family transcriptional regulator, anaerobic regulatory protein [Pricia antarctica]|uniref:CRP/FNR family transcriptional regulator, anaerobic regulatory protein n=1 Tax=Pricia antarctica TaxID=641691 RepID=A0A1G7APM4_9FLAO|nr:Crp/Fnr family transcriptional regulator [Pricia antarctica]SDE15965.1 CRP/FNR family transcriptional regulator, anaerobic regulatory protein [Pricia antarctica]
MNTDNPHFLRCLETLKDALLFRDVSVPALSDMLASMTRTQWKIRTFKNGSEIGSTLHFIVSGRLKEYQINPHTGRERTIFILSKGDVFDILSLMDSKSHEVYWEALDHLEILNIALADFRQWINDYPAMNNAVLRYLGTRIRQLEEGTTDITLHNTLIRLSHLLLNHINLQSQQLELINNLPHSEIASLIGTTRAVVNRHIQELKKCGAITVSRSHIDIQNAELLLAIAEEKFVP